MKPDETMLMTQDDEGPLRLALIIGSTRDGRFGPTVARWFAACAEERGDMTLDVIDLMDLTDSSRVSLSPEAYAERIGQADGVVVVTPEYNHGYPGPLKGAIDRLHVEWQAKPIAFVSYGGISGGLRAVEQLRQVFAELHAVTIRDTVSFHMAHGQFDEAGEPRDPTGPAAAAKVLLDQLQWWADALRAARRRCPYQVG